jgi:hypothetical protein
VVIISPEMKNRILENLDESYQDIQRVEGIAFGLENLMFHFQPFKWYVEKARRIEKQKLKTENIPLREIRLIKKSEWEAMLANEVAKIEEGWRKTI